MKPPIPHGHITKRLKRSLFIIIGLGVIMAGLLGATVGLVNYNITQTAARSKQLATDNLNILLQSQQKFALPENTSYVPATLDQATLVNVVARNQPSVVRIVTIYCGDITLATTKSAVNFADSCTGRVGSGSFISSDGYIATSGHVVSMRPVNAIVESLTASDDIARYLNYLVTNGLMSSHDATTIQTGMKNKDPDAQTMLDATADLIPDAQIHAANETTQYAVQLSDQPVKIDKSGNRLALEYSDTVVKAKLIDEDYNQLTSDQALSTGEFTSSDVALLKSVGSYPYITLGTIDTVKVGDQLTAIGFPTAINGVDSDLTQKVPSITQGKVTGISEDAAVNGRKLIATTVQIGQGNSGGPALNDLGQEVGINSYSTLDCADLKCMGDGQVRDIADIQALLTKNDITLKTGGVINDWSNALTAYTKGNYADALKDFTKVQNEYPANYLVGSLLDVAKQQVGSATDTSTSYQAQGLVIIILIVLGIAILAVAVVLTVLIVIFTHKYHSEMRRTEKALL